MTLAHRYFAGVLVACSLAASLVVVSGQTAAPPATDPSLAQTIPVDPLISTGKLANGLTFYVRKNAKPENRAELRLVVNAGSVLEDDDQLGLAHFVEHMAFNGTKQFPKQEIVSFMESIGMRFGPSVNAFTSFDETVYMLQIPTDKPEVITKALTVLHEWATNVTFDPVEIDKERGVILEEWRLRRSAGARMQDKTFPVLLEGSRYAVRLPIGKPEIIQNFPHDRLRQFYADWYRPDLMAVIAVGDFDAPTIESQIRTQFATIPARPNPRPRQAFPVPARTSTAYAIATDREATITRVESYNINPAPDPRTVGAYRTQIVESMFTGLLTRRFADISQKTDAPFLGANAQRGLFVRGSEAAYLTAVVKEDGVTRGLDALFTEAERVARFGFTATELDRQKLAIQRSMERAVTEKDNQQSADLASEFSRNYLSQEPIPGIVYEKGLYDRFLPTITLAEVNAFAVNFAPTRDRIVVVTAPEKTGLTMPTDTQLAATIAGAVKKELTPYTDNIAAVPLLDRAPTPGRITATATKPAFGITEWTLSNGVRVVLKPTTFKQDEILFSAFSPGGTSLASDENYLSAITASAVVSSGGLGKLSSIDLGKMLTGKVASASASIGSTEERVAGSASPKDLETLFQLIYLRFTQPRADPEVFEVLKTRMRAQLANQAATPEFAFGEMVSNTLTQNHLRTRTMTAEMVDQFDLEKSMAFYKDRFADAGDFTFVFVGTFEPETLRPFVEQYLGGLPSTGRRESWRDEGIRYVTGVVDKEVDKGIEPKSQTTIIFSGPFAYNQEERVAIRALTNVMSTRLRETLREDLGGTYSVSVSPNYTKVPREEYTLSIGFGSAPDRANALVTRVFEEITALQTTPVAEKYVSDTREAFLREWEAGMKQNGYVLSQLVGRYQYGEALDSLFGLDEYYKKLDAATIQRAAQKYLNTNNRLKVMLFPEKR